MSLSLDTVQEIAHLARLLLEPEDAPVYQEQLSAVLAYIDQISDLDLTDIPPTTHAVAQHNVLRDDEATPAMPLEDVLHNAPDQAQNQFRIQAILED
jgi:aspartyl-tRNA(Asn)/glutamyl-tRNA(Gln) amidotransferase subunit C